MHLNPDFFVGGYPIFSLKPTESMLYQYKKKGKIKRYYIQIGSIEETVDRILKREFE